MRDRGLPRSAGPPAQAGFRARLAVRLTLMGPAPALPLPPAIDRSGHPVS